MIKLLLISNHGGGFYNFKRELVECLINYNYEVHFAVPFDEKVKLLKEKGAIHHEINIDRRGMNPIKDYNFIKQIKRIIKEIEPDVLVLHTIKPNIYAGALARIYKIHYINNITGLGSSLQQDSFMAKILRIMYRISIADSAGIFFENIGNQEYFKRYNIGRYQRYHVVAGAGVNTLHFKQDTHSIGERNIRFLFIGRIMREKGVDEFFMAAQSMKEKYSDIIFQVVGFCDEPRYIEMIEKLASERIIEYLGISNDTRIQMSQADCIVLPSYHEGMSNVLLEGAAMGLPLITTDISGCREAVEDGINGLLCKAKDAESLRLAMERFINLTKEERLEMGERGRKKMELEFDRKLVVDKYIKCIQSLVKE